MEYKMIKLGDIATFVNGYAFKPNEWDTKGFPIIRIQNLNNLNQTFNYYSGDIDEKYLVTKGDILISWSASIGVFEWDREDSVLNQHIFKVNFDKIKMNTTYFKFMVSIALKRAMQYMHGSTMKHITKGYFDAIEIPVPSLEIQQKIATILDKAQSLIDKRKEQIEACDELVKSLFYEMFGDPGTNPMKWPEGTIRDIVSEVKYGTSKPAVEGGKYKYLRMNNITYNGFLDMSNLKYIDIPDKEIEKCIVRNGDVLFNRTNSKELVGKTCVFDLDEPMVIAGYIIRVRMNEKALPEYLSAILNSKYGKETLYGMCKAIVGQANINAQELQDIRVFIPPIELQKKYVKFTKQVDKFKFEMEQSLKELENNFNSLMQRAFKGELF